MLAADSATPLWDDAPVAGAFTLADPAAPPDAAIVTAVERPWLFGYAPTTPAPRRPAALVLGGGGYTQLMAGREGVQVAHWLAGLGIGTFVLVHRFPTPASGPHAPLADAIRATAMIRDRGFGSVGVIGLSSGGHLAACLLADPPPDWDMPGTAPRPDWAVIGYAPVSTNAAGRTVVPGKPPLEPPEKQALYDRLQPDAQLRAGPPPVFIAYAADDPVVPVANAHRLAQALAATGAHPELHIFARAPHGFALDTPAGPVTLWPRLCEEWLRQLGVLPPT